MILRELTRKGDKANVTFVLPYDNEPGEVFVAGDFNLWNPGATRLKRRGQMRLASLTLSTGRRYAFRYYRHGRWFNDERADGFEPNEYGEKNCIIDLTSVETKPTALPGESSSLYNEDPGEERSYDTPEEGGRDEVEELGKERDAEGDEEALGEEEPPRAGLESTPTDQHPPVPPP